MQIQIETSNAASTMLPVVPEAPSYKEVIEDICTLNWSALSAGEVTDVAWMYYYFSVQFCETVGIARAMFPHDKKLEELDRGERNTDNLSPCPGVVGVGERVDHDEFMRRTLTLAHIDDARRVRLQAIGATYLETVRAMPDLIRSQSLASYEDGGLERVFRAILNAPDWDGPLLQAFKHFLVGHIELDSDPEGGHGSLCRHLQPTEEVIGAWTAFRDGLIAAAPKLAS